MRSFPDQPSVIPPSVRPAVAPLDGGAPWVPSPPPPSTSRIRDRWVAFPLLLLVPPTRVFGGSTLLAASKSTQPGELETG